MTALIGITGPRIPAAKIAGTPDVLLHARCDMHYAFYPAAVASAGGVPVHVTRDAPPEALVAHLDGLVISGGQDVDPRRYGQEPGLGSTIVDPERDAFEARLVECALDRELPLVGVCRGAQLLNLVRGGTLITQLPRVEHGLVVYPPEHPTHDVHLEPGSRLHELLGDRIRVNSFHHQGIGALGDGVRITGVAPDGVIEAIELDDAPALGVQWHPEMLSGASPVFEWLVAASHDHARSSCP
jgi:putative glutamine amidotransferase